MSEKLLRRRLYARQNVHVIITGDYSCRVEIRFCFLAFKKKKKRRYAVKYVSQGQQVIPIRIYMLLCCFMSVVIVVRARFAAEPQYVIIIRVYLQCCTCIGESLRAYIIINDCTRVTWRGCAARAWVCDFFLRVSSRVHEHGMHIVLNN